MKAKDYNDNELLMMLSESPDEAKDLLYAKYKYIVKIYVKKYQKMAYTLGMEMKDLNQEALVGFSDALNSFDDNNKASLNTFISLCVERRIQSSLLKASRKKNILLNEALSLEHVYDEFDNTLADLLSDNNENNPLTKMTRNEQYSNFVNKILLSLSDNEKDVLYLMIDGLDYKQISTILNIESKSVDNTIQRIKSKVKNIIEENKVNI